MNIAITGSLGNVGKRLAQLILAEGHALTIISSQAERTHAIEEMGAQAAIGALDDAAFLQRAFSDAEVIFAMTPPNLGGSNVLHNTARAGAAIAQAAQHAPAKRIVLLSSIGAEMPSGNGPIAGLHPIEELYRVMEDKSVTLLRAGYFYINFYNDIPLLEASGILGGNLAADTTLPLVHPDDIAAAAWAEMKKPADEHLGTDIRYIVSDVRTPAAIAAAVGNALGKPQLAYLPFSDEQMEQGMLQAGVPAEIASLYTEMGRGLREGKIQQHFLDTYRAVEGATKLEDFAQQFAAKMQR